MELEFLKKLAVKLEKKNNSVFTYPVKKQREYLSRFKTPENDIVRAYNQYCCQMKLKGRITAFFINVASLPLLFYFYNREKHMDGEKEHYDAVFFSEGIPENVIPESLKEEFKKWLIVDKHGEKFTEKDKQYFKNVIKTYPFSWHFLLKCLIKIRLYSYEIEMHSPKAIVVCGEYSFTSSLLTDYCKKNKILHIDVMHGEKLYFMRDSFFRFDRCYVWDKYYADLLIKLRAEEGQFKIEIPPSLKFEMEPGRICKYDYTYYLAAEKEAALEIISESCNALRKCGYRVAVRPHPRYSDIKKIKELFHGDIEVENTQQISIEESVLRTRYAISGYSTVLNQAYYNGTIVVIDDITNPESFKKLVELKYVMLEAEHKLLSEILEEVQ